MNKQIKTLITEINVLYELLKQRMLNSSSLGKLDALQTNLQSSINFSQFEYYRKIFKKLSVVLNAKDSVKWVHKYKIRASFLTLSSESTVYEFIIV